MFVVLLLVAGNETTSNWIGNAVAALLDHPNAYEQMLDDPSRIPDLLEETLRYEPPLPVAFAPLRETWKSVASPFQTGRTWRC